MNIEQFVVRARQADNNEPNKTTERKLALEFAAHVNFITTTDYSRTRATEHAEAALRIIVMLGIRLGLTDDDLEHGLYNPATSDGVLVQAGFSSVAAAFDSVVGHQEPLRCWLHAVATFKAVLGIRSIGFDKALTDFLIPA
ncbi:hypothetical protein HOV30_gp109 [Erwinia phage Derbicus]|uniref:Uncharacterized protein n=2 Tax=Derbicusvirus derbicus TaxID=2734104 RepID=A0A482IDL2_9CAUD|nr:hypothetical protein BIZ82_gp109 [Erwinia phage vB_EamM_EarlPhillipIV]YP_009821153.1 hypothetical protein HOV30_gp109 [Erwinia phage Derbicus]ANZ48958.1 hypothetical protein EARLPHILLIPIV_109 [Erwinia phage vB_EamM_EarlPhillipIV]QBP07535.1 hypothetical protein DERBICUS_109 [Erwinia phage Derbicus]